jgi:hypothetical protein
MNLALLDNITWHTLTGPHAQHAVGRNNARRYARGFSPIVGFADAERPDFASLTPFCEAGEHFYCDGWSGTAPRGWRIESQTTMFKMSGRPTSPGPTRRRKQLRSSLRMRCKRWRSRC